MMTVTTLTLGDRKHGMLVPTPWLFPRLQVNGSFRTTSALSLAMGFVHFPSITIAFGVMGIIAMTWLSRLLVIVITIDGISVTILLMTEWCRVSCVMIRS